MVKSPAKKAFGQRQAVPFAFFDAVSSAANIRSVQIEASPLRGPLHLSAAESVPFPVIPAHAPAIVEFRSFRRGSCFRFLLTEDACLGKEVPYNED
jgi:hypothetical protein